ncbi:MAG: 50S ribosomal protein L17 [Candidatus Gastranaerophilales bacterium]|nr:50S ribosomal protein L17 [Candidatus Gastranaerophilales bacterium]
MRHQCKKHQLSKPQDQRKALLRSLVSSLIMHDEITTTMARAKALKPYAEKLISLAKKGDLAARRQAVRFLFDQPTNRLLNPESGEVFEVDGDIPEKTKLVDETVLRKLFGEIAKKYADRNGGCIRIFRMPPRRGDSSEMALIQLV